MVRENVAITERDGLPDNTVTNGSQDCLLSYTLSFEENIFPLLDWAQAS